MSTRCVIRIKSRGRNHDIYHHHDGYLTGVGKELINIIKSLRGRYVMASDLINALIKNRIDNGYEYTPYIHGDIEYLYEVDFGKDNGIERDKISVKYRALPWPPLTKRGQYKTVKQGDLKSELALYKNKFKK